jgi:hypothetical protein
MNLIEIIHFNETDSLRYGFGYSTFNIFKSGIRLTSKAPIFFYTLRVKNHLFPAIIAHIFDNTYESIQ